jgi:hypothetical protein
MLQLVRFPSQINNPDFTPVNTPFGRERVVQGPRFIADLFEESGCLCLHAPASNIEGCPDFRIRFYIQ